MRLQLTIYISDRIGDSLFPFKHGRELVTLLVEVEKRFSALLKRLFQKVLGTGTAVCVRQ